MYNILHSIIVPWGLIVEYLDVEKYHYSKVAFYIDNTRGLAREGT